MALAKTTVTAELRRTGIAGLAVFGIYAAVSSFFGTWSDEEYTLAATGNGVGYAVHRALTYELQAPLYFAVLAAWREIDASVWFARLFSLLCALGFFFALVAIGKRIAPKTNPLPFALIAVFNPFVAFAAMEIRLYILGLLISALLWLCFDTGFANGTSLRARIAFVFLAVAGTYVQYFIAFMLVGFACAILIRGKVKAILAYAGCSAVAALAIVPLVFVARSQVSGESGPMMAASPLRLFYLTSLHPWLEFFYPHPYYAAKEPRLEHVAYAVLAILVAACWVWARPKLSRELIAVAAIAVAIEVVYIATSVVLGERLSDRYFIALFVPAAAAAYAFERASRARPAIPQRLAIGVFVSLTALSLVTHYRFLAQNGDWKRVAAYLGDRAKPGDLIAIYPADSLPSFERQYAGSVRVAPFPRPNPTDRYVIGAIDVDTTAVASDAFRKLRPYRTVWLVDSVRCNGAAPEYGCDKLEDAVDADFRKSETVTFYMNRIEQLTRRDEASP